MRNLAIGVIGLGKLGLPLAVTLSGADFSVIGFDKSEDLIASLNGGTYQSLEPGINECLKSESGSGIPIFTSNLADLEVCTLFYIIVPTPSDESGKFSSQYVEEAVSAIAKLIQDSESERYIVIVSTLMPGETRRISENHLSKVKAKILYSPEFIALGSVIRNLTKPDSILVGCNDPKDAQLHMQVQRKISSKAKESILNWEEAEIVKLLVNCYVTMKISFANFVGEIGDVMKGVNPALVSEALGLDSRIGSLYLRPGLGFAGPCFPRDNLALLSWAEQIGLQADLSMATVTVNNRQPRIATSRILLGIEKQYSVVMVGIVYKPNTVILDHSQTLAIAHTLKAEGITVDVYDPYLTASDKTVLSASFRILHDLSEASPRSALIVPHEFLHLIDSNKDRFDKVIVL